MKRTLPLVLAILMLPGCSSLSSLNKSIFGKDSKKTQAIYTKVESLEDKQAANSEKRLTHIGAWAAGTDRALQNVTNREPAVQAAKETNERVVALAGKPEYAELQEVYKLVDTLLTNQAAGEKMLAQKDKIIIDLNKSVEETRKERDSVVEKALQQSAANAQHADSVKATLNQMDSFFGLGAIWYGLKKFIVRMAWTIGIGLILFLILRFAASANPIAGAIFSVFEQVVSWFIHAITAIAPKAVSMAGFVTSKLNDDYKVVLTKVVDAVEVVQDRAKAANTPPLVSEVMTEMSKANLTPAQQGIITTIKTTLNWK